MFDALNALRASELNRIVDAISAHHMVSYWLCTLFRLITYYSSPDILVPEGCIGGQIAVSPLFHHEARSSVRKGNRLCPVKHHGYQVSLWDTSKQSSSSLRSRIQKATVVWNYKFVVVVDFRKRAKNIDCATKNIAARCIQQSRHRQRNNSIGCVASSPAQVHCWLIFFASL